MKKYIYLAGPIAGCTEEEATGWRDYVVSMLPYGIIGISPIRWSDPRAIATKNWLDTESCDLVLAYLPKELNDKRPSYGTTIEIGWAIGLRKPLIVISDDEYLMKHPLIKHNASWRLDNLEDAVEVIIGLFGDYVGPVRH